MKNNKIYLKLFSAVLAILFVLPFLSSCTQNKTVIGTVNGEKVYYDELYFLVSNYKRSVAEKCNNDPALMQKELDKLVRENIVTNYAMLALCEEFGLNYGDIEAEVDGELELFILDNFNGDRTEYKDSCKAIGMSERYHRHLLALDLLCEKLPAKYVEKKLVLTEESDIIAYVKDNFVRTNHLVIFNDEGDDIKANENKITEAKNRLDRGEKINSLIGKGFSEDFSDPDASGYHFTKGTMVEDYENVAFSLEVGEYSDIVRTYSQNNSDEYVSCFYIIQRLEMSDEYIDKYYIDIKNDYYNSIIYNDMTELKESMKFIPNEKYNDLDLTDLPDTTDITTIVVISVLTTVAVVAVVTVIILKQIHKKKNISYNDKKHRRK